MTPLLALVQLLTDQDAGPLPRGNAPPPNPPGPPRPFTNSPGAFGSRELSPSVLAAHRRLFGFGAKLGKGLDDLQTRLSPHLMERLMGLRGGQTDDEAAYERRPLSRSYGQNLPLFRPRAQ